MTPADEIRRVRLAVARLLIEMGLGGYAYTVEHKPHGWTLSIECTGKEGWQVTTLPVDPAELCASLEDANVRDKLRRDWAPHLQACVKRSDRPSRR